MTSRFMTRSAFVLMLAAASAATSAPAQTALGTRYGSGYVGNVPNSVPVTSFYRGPGALGHAQPVTTMYAPTTGIPVTAGYAPATAYAQATGYSPAISYRVGTASAAPYTSAYSPVVTPTTLHSANWQYPPQTTMPTTAQPVVANYAPMPPYYTTNYAATPVTYYRPVTVMSPVGIQQTVLQPCTGTEHHARRHCGGFLSWLFHHKAPAQPVVTVPTMPAPVLVPPTITNYPCATPSPCTTGTAPCASGACPTSATPYYTPGPATTTIPSITTTIPANQVPSLSSPPPSYPGAGSTIVSPGATIAPSPLNSSGPQRLDYPPAETYTPNVSPLVPLAPLPNENGTSGNGAAGETPSLLGPANAPIGNGVLEQYKAPDKTPADPGAQLSPRPSFNVDTRQPPKAVLRRDNTITPIPDPEYPSGTRAKVNKAPMLISPRDKTAQTSHDAEADARLASFERQVSPAPAPVGRIAPATSKVLGDDIWRSAK